MSPLGRFISHHWASCQSALEWQERQVSPTKYLSKIRAYWKVLLDFLPLPPPSNTHVCIVYLGEYLSILIIVYHFLCWCTVRQHRHGRVSRSFPRRSCLMPNPNSSVFHALTDVHHAHDVHQLSSVSDAVLVLYFTKLLNFCYVQNCLLWVRRKEGWM